MIDLYETVKTIDLKISTDQILFFDLDGTLVDTDFANFLSYKKAIQSIIQTDKDISYNPKERFNRSYLKRDFPILTGNEYEKIILEKEEKFKENLSHTKLNQSVADILKLYSKTNQTVLVTNCREDRALMTLNYHNLTRRYLINGKKLLGGS